MRRAPRPSGWPMRRMTLSTPIPRTPAGCAPLWTSSGWHPAGRAPAAWRTTIADVAADLDVIDLTVLVDAWARSVREDWAAVGATRR